MKKRIGVLVNSENDFALTNKLEEEKFIYFGFKEKIGILERLKGNYIHIKLSEYYREMAEKFIKDYVLSKYGTTSPMHTAREDFYSRKLSENDFSFVIGDAILKEYGVDIDPKEVKKLFNERAQQLQKENIKKSQLQQREEELSDLEMERDELLLIEKRDEQQNIGE